MFSRCEQRCFIKIQVARGRNISRCFRALQEACVREVTNLDIWFTTVLPLFIDCLSILNNTWSHQSLTGQPSIIKYSVHRIINFKTDFPAYYVLLKSDPSYRSSFSLRHRKIFKINSTIMCPPKTPTLYKYEPTFYTH